MSPGPENFIFLNEMYGVPNNRRFLLRKLAQRGTSSSSSRLSSTLAEEEDKVYIVMRQEIQKAVKQMEQRTDGREHLDGWFEEHRNEYGSVHSRDFGGGCKVKVAKLLVGPDES